MDTQLITSVATLAWYFGIAAAGTAIIGKYVTLAWKGRDESLFFRLLGIMIIFVLLGGFVVFVAWINIGIVVDRPSAAGYTNMFSIFWTTLFWSLPLIAVPLYVGISCRFADWGEQ